MVDLVPDRNILASLCDSSRTNYFLAYGQSAEHGHVVEVLVFLKITSLYDAMQLFCMVEVGLDTKSCQLD